MKYARHSRHSHPNADYVVRSVGDTSMSLTKERLKAALV
jgi:hypothetical protein